MQTSGVDAAIQELEREVKRVQEAIAMLRKIQSQRGSARVGTISGRVRRLSPQARRRISEAAKKRWAAYRAQKKASKAS